MYVNIFQASVTKKLPFILCRQEATSRLYVFTSRGSDSGHDAFGSKGITEGEHLLVGGREVWRVGYLMETDKVDAALHTIEQSTQLLDVAW